LRNFDDERRGQGVVLIAETSGVSNQQLRTLLPGQQAFKE